VCLTISLCTELPAPTLFTTEVCGLFYGCLRWVFVSPITTDHDFTVRSGEFLRPLSRLWLRIVS